MTESPTYVTCSKSHKTLSRHWSDVPIRSRVPSSNEKRTDSNSESGTKSFLVYHYRITTDEARACFCDRPFSRRPLKIVLARDHVPRSASHTNVARNRSAGRKTGSVLY